MYIRSVRPDVLYTKLDAQCDKLVTVVGRTKTNNTYNGRCVVAKFF